jgi:hypothetical protein
VLQQLLTLTSVILEAHSRLTVQSFQIASRTVSEQLVIPQRHPTAQETAQGLLSFFEEDFKETTLFVGLASFHR